MIAVFVFAAATVLIVVGAAGVVASRNPVHAALFLVQTLFGVALLFLLQGANFLAAVQLIVYAGAIVILFLFVIMLLGVDKAEDLQVEPIPGQRLLAAVLGTAFAAMLITVAVVSNGDIPGMRQADSVRALDSGVSDVERLGQLLFSNHAFAVLITAALLTIAVVAAVVLTRADRIPKLQDPPQPTALDRRPGTLHPSVGGALASGGGNLAVGKVVSPTEGEEPPSEGGEPPAQDRALQTVDAASLKSQ